MAIFCVAIFGCAMAASFIAPSLYAYRAEVVIDGLRLLLAWIWCRPFVLNVIHHFADYICQNRAVSCDNCCQFVPYSFFVPSLYSFYIGKSIAILAANFITGEKTRLVPPPKCRMAFAKPFSDGRFVKHRITVVRSAGLFLFFRPLLKSGLQCLYRSDDNGVGLSRFEIMCRSHNL